LTTTVQQQVLINARALIADPARWTKGTLACTANGKHVDCHDQSAAKWCAMRPPTISAATRMKRSASATRLPEASVQSVGLAAPPLNDRRGYAAVLKVFDKALQAA
jgi:hypothetical protein